MVTATCSLETVGRDTMVLLSNRPVGSPCQRSPGQVRSPFKSLDLFPSLIVDCTILMESQSSSVCTFDIITGRICPKGSSASIVFTHGPLFGFFARRGNTLHRSTWIKVKFGKALLPAKFQLDRSRAVKTF